MVSTGYGYYCWIYGSSSYNYRRKNNYIYTYVGWNWHSMGFHIYARNNLIQSRLDRLRTSSINKSSTAQDIMRQKKEVDNGLLALSSSSSSSMPILDDTKVLIISKINNIDKLKDEEVEFLIDMIRNLY